MGNAVHDLAETYNRRRPALRRALRRLRALLSEVEAAVEDRTLVRARLGDSRIKTLSSLRLKAERNSWKPDGVFMHCGDLIGARVVCNNVEDIYRFAELLKERLPGDEAAVEIQDWIKNPNERGYRALHVNFRLDVSDWLAPDLISCEVQIRTRLQDAWGELTHGDIYKQPDLPEDLQARSADLAEILAAADKIATGIRQRVQEAVAPQLRPDLQAVAQGGLAFVFREIFGRSPPDYVVRQALNLCEELDIRSLERFPEILARAEFRDQLAKAYQSIMPVRANAEGIFLAALHALARDDRQALNYIRREARREFREIDAIAKREMLSALPRTIDELLTQLEDPQSDANVESWAATLETTGSCKICGTTIVRADAFADAVVRHYEPANPEDIRKRIETAIYQSSVELGGWGDSGLCSYHDDRADKD